MAEGEFRVPAPEDEARRSLIEAAWAQLESEVRHARQELVDRRPGSWADISAVAGALPTFLAILAGQCRALPADELTSLDRVVERKLWELDRADIYAVTGGSDDGFLYSSCIAAVSSSPWAGSSTMPWRPTPRWACRSPSARRCATFFAHLSYQQFGDFPDTGSGISRETGSNLTGWI